MGKVALIVGESGSGKSASLRNFEPNEVAIFNVSEKPLPFRKKLPCCNTSDMRLITAEIKRNTRNCYVVDDAGLAMTFFMFGKINENGYGKFTQVAKDFYDMVQAAIRDTSDDTITYFTMHVDRSEDGTKLRAKTAGKMIDSQLTLESLFSIVLYCVTDGKRHYFVTQSDGVTTAKSPMDMFPLEIDNDLKAVDAIIREYYGMAAAGTPVTPKESKIEPVPCAARRIAVETTDRLPG